MIRKKTKKIIGYSVIIIIFIIIYFVITDIILTLLMGMAALIAFSEEFE